MNEQIVFLVRASYILNVVLWPECFVPYGIHLSAFKSTLSLVWVGMWVQAILDVWLVRILLRTQTIWQDFFWYLMVIKGFLCKL